MPRDLLAQEEQPEPRDLLGEQRSIGQRLGRQAGLTARAGIEGVTDVASVFANPLAIVANTALEQLGSDLQFPVDQSGFMSETLTRIGLPEPEGGVEKTANIGGRLLTGMAAGGPLNTAAARRFGVPTGRTTGAPKPASTPAARTLAEEGVPLDRAQRSGGVLANRVRSFLSDNPMTTGRQQEFTQQQLRGFTRAALRTIGEEADEATQQVMRQAATRIGGVFDRIARRSPAFFDDVLQDDLARIIREAGDELDPNQLKILERNVDRILNAVKPDGRILGSAFQNIRTTLGRISRRPEIGHFARELQESLVGALGRSSPKDQAALQQASTQFRNLRIIEQTIGKGADKFISPLRLSNRLASASNRAMSVFGRGGDQRLVRLAEAGRTVLPETLPQSGTIPRGMMQAPLRAVATAPIAKLVQARMLSTPGLTTQGSLVRAQEPLLAALLAQGTQRAIDRQRRR